MAIVFLRPLGLRLGKPLLKAVMRRWLPAGDALLVFVLAVQLDKSVSRHVVL